MNNGHSLDPGVALAGIIDQLARIADALEAQATALAPSQPLPDLVRPLADFPTFNWHSIDATVIETDQYGPTLVEYRGKTYKRRSPENKFDAAIWFSRSVGKDEEGQNQYEKFITFKEMAPAEPLSRAAEAKINAPKPAPRAPQPHDAEREFGQMPSAAREPAQAAALAQAEEERAARAAFEAREAQLAGAGQGKAANGRPIQPPAPHPIPSGLEDDQQKEQQEDLLFKDQGSAVLWAAQYPHYQKPDGSPDYQHLVPSHTNVVKQAGRDLHQWGPAWVKHVKASAAGKK